MSPLQLIMHIKSLTFAYMVRWLDIHTLSVPSEPGESVYPGGGIDAGATSGQNSIADTCCSRRTSMNDISLYANCVRIQLALESARDGERRGVPVGRDRCAGRR